MPKTIKSQSFDSPKELEVINPINSKNVEFWIHSGTGTAMNIVVSREELLEALNAQEKPEPPFEFPTEIGSVIQAPNLWKYTLYTNEPVEKPWICPRGGRYSEKYLREIYGNELVVIR